MKKLRILIVFLCLINILTLSACTNKNLPSANIMRDEARTGGSLSFVYDKNQKTVFVGGDEEIVQFSSADELRNLPEGNRVGIKVIAPQESLDLSNASLEMNGVNYSSADFLESINGENQRFFYLFPIVSKDKPTVKFAVTWQEGTKKQEYKLTVVKGTRFMQKDGSVE